VLLEISIVELSYGISNRGYTYLQVMHPVLTLGLLARGFFEDEESVGGFGPVILLQ
jgi:hypothetical protein